MKEKIIVPIAVILISGIALTGCAGSVVDKSIPHLEAEPIETAVPEESNLLDEPSVEDEAEEFSSDRSFDFLRQIPSTDINDYFEVTINAYDIDFYRIDTGTSTWYLHELPLNMLVAYFLGTDGAYSYAATYELRTRFLETPDEILEYVVLVGDNIVRTETVKELLCAAIVAPCYFDDTDIQNTDMFEATLEDLENKHNSPQSSVAEILIILRGLYEQALRER